MKKILIVSMVLFSIMFTNKLSYSGYYKKQKNITQTFVQKLTTDIEQCKNDITKLTKLVEQQQQDIKKMNKKLNKKIKRCLIKKYKIQRKISKAKTRRQRPRSYKKKPIKKRP